MSDNPALMCGLDPYDGLLVAYLPKLDGVMQEAYNRYVDWEGRTVTATVYSIDGMAIDAKTDPDSLTMKWWRVRNWARELGLSIVEPIWGGAVKDFSLRHLPDVPQPHGAQLHMRAFSHGPWINISPEHMANIDGPPTSTESK